MVTALRMAYIAAILTSTVGGALSAGRQLVITTEDGEVFDVKFNRWHLTGGASPVCRTTDTFALA